MLVVQVVHVAVDIMSLTTAVLLTYVQVKSDRRTPQQQCDFQTHPVFVGERVVEGSSQEVRQLR